MKKTIFNSKNLLLNAILLSFLFLFTALFGATFFSYTVDASTSYDEIFYNIFGNLNYPSNSNNFKNYRLPGQKDSKFPHEKFKSLNQEPMFEHKPDDDPGVFTVPSRNYKFGVPFDDVNPRTANLLLPYADFKITLTSSNHGTSQTSPEDANSINQGTDQSSSEEINLYERATSSLNEQSLGSSALDYFPNKNPDKVIADAQSFLSQDSDDEICPNCENLVGIHYVNVSSLNPIWQRMLHDECSQTNLYCHIANHFSDYEDKNSPAYKDLQKKGYSTEEIEKAKAEVKNAAYEIHEVQDDGNVETVNISPAEYWEDQNEGAKNFVEFDNANILAEEQFAFNTLYPRLENQHKANTYYSIFE